MLAPVSNVVQVSLPCYSSSPLLHAPAPGSATTVLSVRVRGAPLDQLKALLTTQRPCAVVLSPRIGSFGADEASQLVSVATSHCPNVSIKGSFSKAWARGQTVPIFLAARTTSFCMEDDVPGGSMHGNNVVVFGDLSHLMAITVHTDSHVYMAGLMSPYTRVHIKARSLTFNGYTMPVYPNAGPGMYMFTNVPGGERLMHPKPPMPPPLPPPKEDTREATAAEKPTQPRQPTQPTPPNSPVAMCTPPMPPTPPELPLPIALAAK